MTRAARAAAVAIALLALGTAPQAAEPEPAPNGKDAKPPLNLETVPPGSALSILGTAVHDAAGVDMGHIVDILVNREGMPRAAVIDVGGFLGVGSRKVAIDWQLIYFRPTDEKIPILLDLTRAQVQAAPEYKGINSAQLVVPPPAEGRSVPDDAK